MKTFIDPATKQIYALEDDVVVTTNGKLTTFATALGDALTLPPSLVPYVVPLPTATEVAAAAAAQFASNKAAALAAVDQFHAQTVQALAGNPTQVEKDSWAMKLTTANAVTAKVAVSAEGTAFMTAAGLTTSALQAAWAAKVLTNAANYAGLVGVADNLRTASKTAITTAATQAALDAAIVANRAAADTAIAVTKAKLGIA